MRKKIITTAVCASALIFSVVGGLKLNNIETLSISTTKNKVVSVIKNYFSNTKIIKSFYYDKANTGNRYV